MNTFSILSIVFGVLMFVFMLLDVHRVNKKPFDPRRNLVHMMSWAALAAVTFAILGMVEAAVSTR